MCVSVACVCVREQVRLPLDERRGNGVASLLGRVWNRASRQNCSTPARKKRTEDDENFISDSVKTFTSHSGRVGRVVSGHFTRPAVGDFIFLFLLRPVCGVSPRPVQNGRLIDSSSSRSREQRNQPCGWRTRFAEPIRNYVECALPHSETTIAVAQRRAAQLLCQGEPLS